VLIVLAGALRLYHLGFSSIRIDEGASITTARLPWRELVRTLWRHEGNMTPYHLLLRGWIHIGDSESALRSLSALVGTPMLVQHLKKPGDLPRPFPRPRQYAAGGLTSYRGVSLHVSRGTGMERGSAPQLRFLCPPEICLVEVRY